MLLQAVLCVLQIGTAGTQRLQAGATSAALCVSRRKLAVRWAAPSAQQVRRQTVRVPLQRQVQ
jgi:hypothetical protein